MSIYAPEQRAYTVKYHNLTAKEKASFRRLLSKRRASKSIVMLEKTTIAKLRSGAQICFHPAGYSISHKEGLGDGIVWKRRGPVVQALNEIRLFTITLNERHPAWQEYRKQLAAKKVCRFIAQQRPIAFRSFLQNVHDSRSQWLWSGSEFEASVTIQAQEQWPKKRKAVGQLFNLLRYAY